MLEPKFDGLDKAYLPLTYSLLTENDRSRASTLQGQPGELQYGGLGGGAADEACGVDKDAARDAGGGAERLVTESTQPLRELLPRVKAGGVERHSDDLPATACVTDECKEHFSLSSVFFLDNIKVLLPWYESF